MKVSGLVIKEMVMVYRYGLMVQNMKENGKKIGLKVKESSIMLMVIFLRASGPKIRVIIIN